MGLQQEQEILSPLENQLRQEMPYGATASVDGRDISVLDERKGWYREERHGREVEVGEIAVHPSPIEGKYKMTAVIDGQVISHEISQKDYDKVLAVDDYHRMKIFSKIFNEVDMKPIMDLRAQFKDKFKEKHEVGLGFMSFFTKAVCAALQDFPVINAYLDGDDIVYNDFCDISIAVSSPRGLVVPVIRDAQNLSFAGVEKEIVRLAIRARDGKLGIDEMTGGTFTITNGGIFGSMLSTPIINAPQSAILGMHNIVERAVVVKGEIVIRPIMYVALSYDHRIIDGKDSVSFLVRVKQLLEDPTRLLLEL